MDHFWVWNQLENDPDGGRELAIEGVIASESSWYDDAVTPALFRAELFSSTGDVVVRINSPGGDTFAAAQIYDMLREYTGRVTVRVPALAASAASVIAMAGDQVEMTPVGMMMIHNPSTIAIGDRVEMSRALALLDECREALVNAYERKTGLPRNQIAQMMDDETWLSSAKALELGFIDAIHVTEKNKTIKVKKQTAAAFRGLPMFACSTWEVQKNAFDSILRKMGNAALAAVQAPAAASNAQAAANSASNAQAAAVYSIPHTHTLAHTHNSHLYAPKPEPQDTQRAALALCVALASADL